METFLFLLELAGTVAFAVSGAVLGIEKHMDIFGVGLLLQEISYFGYGTANFLSGQTPAGATWFETAFPFRTFRIMGVLQGLALAYLFGSVALLCLRFRHLIAAAGGLLLLYLVLLQTGNGYSLSADNIIAVVDRAVLGESHLYKEWLPDGSRLAFEPEGLLSTLPRIAQFLLGCAAGRILLAKEDAPMRFGRLFAFGTALLFAGLLLQYGDPLNKKIWSSSFALTTSGFASLLLGLLWVLSACGMDNSVEDLFTLPRIPDEYTGLNQQIEDLLANGYEYAPPATGQNIQAVQMVDLNGDDVQEALVFFRKPVDEKPLKILVFERLEESYELLCTVESSGNSIDSVYYEDLTGDGRNELVVGWKISSTVQNVAVYNIGREAIPLMSSSYTRFVVQDLNSYDPPALFVMRSDGDGTPVAEVYTWQTNILAVAYRCGLSSTMSDLARGSVVKGTLTGGKPAVFITSVNDNGNAVTDILTWENRDAVVNLTMDESSGKTTLIQPYRQLIPQDVNDDGVTEVPFPDAWSNGNDTLTSWRQDRRTGSDHLVAQT